MPATIQQPNTQSHQLAEQYFQTFNENQFDKTAALFTQAGKLIPPFDSPVVGEDAILTYLQKEADNITAYPQHWESEEEGDRTFIKVIGKVNAVVFKVNVAWYFIIPNTKTDALKIESVRVKLLASPKELLGLRSAASQSSS